jgi:hypothetical protein
MIVKAMDNLAVSNYVSSKTVAGRGYNVRQNVTVRNSGYFNEAFNVTCYYGNQSLTSEMWNGFWSMGDALLDGRINQEDIDFIMANFNWHGPPGQNRADVNKDGVVNMKDIATCILHQGLEIWTYYLSGAAIGRALNVSLSIDDYAILSFTWNTSALPFGNYITGAYAEPVQNETILSDNQLELSVIVTIPGDLNGDYKVSLADLVLLANAYGTTPSSPWGTGLHQWNPNADIDGNLIVGLTDLVILALHYGQHYP